MKRDLKTELYVILSVYDNTLFQIPSSVSGTGRTGGDKGAGLPGHLPRGHGSQTSTHYGTVAHTSAGLGQLQGDAIREMKGEAVMAGGTGNGLYSGVLNSVHYDTEIAWLTSSGKTQVQFRRLQFIASKALPVANENRPVNRAVRYLIRAR